MFKEFDTDLMEEFVTDYNKSKRQRRKTIKDKYITTEVFIKLMDIGISNNIMAQVINAVIPNAKATSNSVAAIVNTIRKENKKVDELLQDIEEL